MQSRSNFTPPIQRSYLFPQQQQIKNIGKWNDQQKKIFITYYSLFESIQDKYELMAEHIKTRSPCQVRSHWQKVMEKMNRDKQKIGKGTLPIDIALGKQNFDNGFQDFNISASDFMNSTGRGLLNLRAIQLKFMVNNSGKPNCRQTRSMLPKGEEMFPQFQQEVFEGMKVLENYFIVRPPGYQGLQKGHQLQNQGKINEESNASSNIESMQRQKSSQQGENFAYFLKYELNTKGDYQ